MGAQGIVVQPGQGPVSSGRSFSLKLRGGTTGDSIMMFEETIPAGTKSTFHLHHDSDEVAYVLSGEFTFKIGDEVKVGFRPMKDGSRGGQLMSIKLEGGQKLCSNRGCGDGSGTVLAPF